MNWIRLHRKRRGTLESWGSVADVVPYLEVRAQKKL